MTKKLLRKIRIANEKAAEEIAADKALSELQHQRLNRLTVKGRPQQIVLPSDKNLKYVPPVGPPKRSTEFNPKFHKNKKDN